MEDADRIADLWMTGKQAPYALYDSGRWTSGGSQVLVEAIGGDRTPVVQRGDIISPELSERVSKQVYADDPVMLTITDEFIPPEPPPVEPPPEEPQP